MTMTLTMGFNLGVNPRVIRWDINLDVCWVKGGVTSARSIVSVFVRLGLIPQHAPTEHHSIGHAFGNQRGNIGGHVGAGGAVDICFGEFAQELLEFALRAAKQGCQLLMRRRLSL